MVKVKKNSLTKILVIVVVLTLAVVALNIYFNLHKNLRDGTTTAVPISAEDKVMGSNNSYVTIVEYSDYQCPVCRRFHEEIFLDLKARYIDTGKVRFVFKDLPLTNIHPYAMEAAEASHCADEQGKYWEYHEVLFKNSPKLDDYSLKQYAAQLGMNASQFSQCVDSNKYGALIQKTTDEASELKVQGTPTLYVNGQIIPGMPDKAQFFALIDEEIIAVRSGGKAVQ